MGVMRPELVMKSIVPVRGRERERVRAPPLALIDARRDRLPPPPLFLSSSELTHSASLSLSLSLSSLPQVVMAGVLGIYGLIIAVIISTGSELEWKREREEREERHFS